MRVVLLIPYFKNNKFFFVKKSINYALGVEILCSKLFPTLKIVTLVIPFRNSNNCGDLFPLEIRSIPSNYKYSFSIEMFFFHIDYRLSF